MWIVWPTLWRLMTRFVLARLNKNYRRRPSDCCSSRAEDRGLVNSIRARFGNIA